MKHIIILFTIFSFTALHTQYNKGTVYFKGSKTTEGLIRVKSNGIKFKPTENAEIIEYNHEQIKGYDVKGWQFRYVQKNETSAPKLLKLILEGKISIYEGDNFSPGLLKSDGTVNDAQLIMSTYRIYFIKANDKLIKIINKFKNKQLEIFNDCSELIEKIQQKEFKKWDIYDIVEFYNEECGRD